MTTLRITEQTGQSYLAYSNERIEILKDFKKGDFFSVQGLSGNRIIGIANGSFNTNGLPTTCWVDGDSLVVRKGISFTEDGRCSVTDASSMEIVHLLTMIKNAGYELDGSELIKYNWRADFGCNYLYVSSSQQLNSAVECGHDVDGERFLSGNYFNPSTDSELAEEIANKQKQLYKR